VHVAELSLRDFRSYADVELSLSPGLSTFVGPNGQGKTNLVEAVEYVAMQSSHRVWSDQPLVRHGAEQAVVRACIRRGDRQALVELEINPGRSNRGRLNRGTPSRARDVLGVLRAVVFSPDDLSLVKGDPGERRRFLDDLLVARQPRFSGVRLDYERVLKQRNSLLKTAGGRTTGRRSESAMATLEVWDAHLAKAGAELLVARLRLVRDLAPRVAEHYRTIASATTRPGADTTAVTYQASWELPPDALERADVAGLLVAELARKRDDELDRGITLVGPHRDDLQLGVGGVPARGYASHGESWSLALALRLSAFDLLREDADDPVLILDDVFAELDEQRRTTLARLVADTEQVLVTAAVPADLPPGLGGHRFCVADGKVSAHAG
jgi:DNA replication and repair protein RecF